MNNSQINQVLSNFLGIFKSYVPSSAGTVSKSLVSVVNFKERSVGLGNRISTVKFGGFNLQEIKGMRFDTLVRFQQLADTFEAINSDHDKLCNALLTDLDNLKKLGILQLNLERSSDIEFVASINAWRIISDYKILYEFQYTDSDDAASLIAQIPIESRLENFDQFPEVFDVYSENMIRWDNESASPLLIKGPAELKILSGISFIPSDIPSGHVSIIRSFFGTTQEPKIYASLSSFWDSVAGQNSTEINAQVKFDSISDFLNTLTSTYEPLLLGDWNLEDKPDQYEVASTSFKSSICLKSKSDFFNIKYEGIKFNHPGVVYLRADKE
jgi:hypothetical protein